MEKSYWFVFSKKTVHITLFCVFTTLILYITVKLFWKIIELRITKITGSYRIKIYLDKNIIVSWNIHIISTQQFLEIFFNIGYKMVA